MEEEITKKCPDCNKEKPLSEFGKDSSSKDGKYYKCKKCKNIKGTESYNKVGRTLTTQQKKRKSKRDVDYKRNRRRTDPLYRMKDNLSRMLRKKLKSLGTKKELDGDWLGCSDEKFKQHIESQFEPWMNWYNYGEWEIDHNIPLKAAKTIEEVYKINNYINLVPLRANDNWSKNGFYLEEDKQRFLDSLK